VRARVAELEKQRDEWVRYPPDNQSFMLMSMVLAAYQVLRDRVDRDVAITAVRHAFTQMWGDWIRAGTEAQLDAAPDPVVSMTATARTKEESTFGPSFVFEHERDDQNAYWVKITRRLYYSYFVAHAAPELTPVFCDWDANWASAINPARHGFRYDRPTALGLGGDGCYFRHTREPATAKAES
jgi:hypothetical protein